jgi:hypothetical protein
VFRNFEPPDIKPGGFYILGKFRVFESISPDENPYFYELILTILVIKCNINILSKLIKI